MASQLSREFIHEQRFSPVNENERGEPAEDYLLGSEAFGEDHLELTIIGETAVLSASAANELELQAALAYAIVKRRRRRLLEDLANSDAEAATGWEKRLPFARLVDDEDGGS